MRGLLALLVGAVVASGCIRFDPGVHLSASANPAATASWLVAGDFTGDGGADVLVRSSDGSVVRMDSCGAACLEPREQIHPAPSFGRVADFDGDGIDDLLVSDRLYFGGAAGGGRPDGLTMDDSVPFTASEYSVVYVGDFTGDGRADLIGRQYWMSYYMRYALATGDGAGGFSAWSPSGITILNAGGDGSAIGDVDGDGELELALLFGGVQIIHPDEVVTTIPPAYDLGIGEFAFGDIDGDGRDDLVHRSSRNGLTFHRSTGTGFTPFTHWETIPAPYGSGYVPALLLQDFDGDDLADLYYDDFGTNQVWRSGTGDGGFPYHVVAPPPSPPTSAPRVFADIDGDGLPEVIQGNAQGNAGISVFANTSV